MGRRRRRGAGVSRRGLLGSVAIALGGGSLLSESSAYTAVTGARPTSVSTAADDAAQLSLTQLGDASTPVTFTNRSGRSMLVTVTSPDAVDFDVGDDDTNEGSTATFSIAQGASVDVDLLADGTVLLDVVAELQENGTTVGRIELQREAEAQSQAGQVQVTPNVKSAGNSGKYEFGLENTGDIDVTIEGIGILETTNPDAVEVAGGAILDSPQGSVLSRPIPIDSTQPDSDTRRTLDQTVSLNTNEGEKIFEFDRFLTANGNNAKMKGDDVRIRLYFTDGSSTVVDLCLNGCSF
jgi:hypothetical protein